MKSPIFNRRVWDIRLREFVKRLGDHLKRRWVVPSYSGGVVLGFAIGFFLLATTTQTNWLYAMSGMAWALLAIAAVLSRRNLKGVQVSRRSIYPVCAGQPLTIEVLIQNTIDRRKELLQIEDSLPIALGTSQQRVVEMLAPKGTQYWAYEQPTKQRGMYQWQTLCISTAAPFGLFECCREVHSEAIALVYPTVLPLEQCPLLDQFGRQSQIRQRNLLQQHSTEGFTRSLRPYRWGDSYRSIHWRSSARYGELRVREWEDEPHDRSVIIALDSAGKWNSAAFEEAVTAAASLYYYGLHHQWDIGVWIASKGIMKGEQAVLEALAVVQRGEVARVQPARSASMIWLTANSETLRTLPVGSQTILWNETSARSIPGVIPRSNESLQRQLESASSLL